MRQPKEVPKQTPGVSHEQNYRELIREDLAEACEDLDIPKMYRPGVVNSPDLSLAMFTLSLYEHVVALELKVAKPKMVKVPSEVVPAKKKAAKKKAATKKKAAAAPEL